MATDFEIALWMAEKLRQEKRLYQATVALEIKEQFGEKFVFKNKNGNLGIKKSVTEAFLRTTRSKAVWVSGSRYWRLRSDGDPAGQRQVD